MKGKVSNNNNVNISRSSNTKNETYSQIKLLGKGSFGKAYLVQCSISKVIYNKNLGTSSNKNNDFRKYVRN